MNGFILVDKPVGMTSFDVIAILRKKLNTKKIGHSGTLDPNASGLLKIAVGNCTKMLQFLEYETKEYLTEFTFGMDSDTYDIWGEVSTSNNALPTLERIKETLDKNFIGEIEQYPPIYSAKKVNGKKLYEYARANKEVEIKPAKILIKSIEILSYQDKKLVLRIACGKGTYIRSLAHDLGVKLDCPCVMSNLIRTRVGNSLLNDAYKLDDIDSNTKLSEPYDILNTYSYIEVEDDKSIIQGKPIKLDCDQDIVIITKNRIVLAAYQKYDDGLYHCKRGLL